MVKTIQDIENAKEINIDIPKYDAKLMLTTNSNKKSNVISVTMEPPIIVNINGAFNNFVLYVLCNTALFFSIYGTGCNGTLMLAPQPPQNILFSDAFLPHFGQNIILLLY
jgi:hypothetical protein